MINSFSSIGIDVGGTTVKLCVTDEDGAILARHAIPTAREAGARAIIESIIEGIQYVIDLAGITISDVQGIGLGVPGTANSERGIVIFAPNIFMSDCHIVAEISQVYDVPICLAQDTRAAAWGEYVAGAGKNMTSVATVTLGTGIGCGMVIDGKIFHGALNTAGEFGHQIVELDGNPCNCGRHGCLEAHAGGLAIVREAQGSIPRLGDLLGKNSELVSAKDVFSLAEQGNPQARVITDRVVKYVGMSLVNLINLVSPELLTISGGISNSPAGLLLDPLFDFIRNRAYPLISESIELCRSPLNDDAPLVGAALLYKEPTYRATCKTRV